MRRSTSWLYRWPFRAGWLRSYTGRFLFVALAGTHAPLLALVVYRALSRGEVFSARALWVTLAATLAGSLAVLWSLCRILYPVHLAGRVLRRHLAAGGMPEMPEIPGDVPGAAGALLRDVSRTLRAFAEYQEQMERHATTDLLTGLLNRRGAEERLRDSLSGDGARPVYVALLDLDRFKRVNDDRGHGVGDLALRAMGAYLTATLRPPDGWAARWGGDEFLIVRRGLADRREAARRLDRLRREVPALDVGDGGTLPLEVSIGMTTARHGEETDAVLRRADVALYAAKRNGRNQVWDAEADQDGPDAPDEPDAPPRPAG